jgi:hypothetical protein
MIAGPSTMPLPMRVISAPPFTPFPQPGFLGGVSGGPLVALFAMQAGAAALSAIAVAGGGRWPDLRIPGVLVLIAAVGHVLLWGGLVVPVRRFAAATARMAAQARVDLLPRGRIAELDRVALGLYRFHPGGVSRRSSRPRRLVVRLAAAPVLVALLVLGWVVPSAVATVGGAALPVEEVVRAAGVRADERAAELDAALGRGLTALERAADPPTGGVVADPATTVNGVLAAERLFRSVAVVDRAGRPMVTAGPAFDEPLAIPPAVPRVVQANTSGSEPLVRASAPIGDGATALVAEFDPRALNDVIRAAGGNTRVVDPQRATVLDSGGYTAFEPLDDPALGELVASLSPQAPRAERPVDGRGAATRLVSAPGAPTDLGWVLVEERGVAVAALADDGSRRATLVVIAVTASLALGALAWTAVTVVLPARRLARHVERLAAGDEVPPLAPQRLDELGTAVAATNQFVVVRSGEAGR